MVIKQEVVIGINEEKIRSEVERIVNLLDVSRKYGELIFNSYIEIYPEFANNIKFGEADWLLALVSYLLLKRDKVSFDVQKLIKETSISYVDIIASMKQLQNAIGSYIDLQNYNNKKNN